MQWTQAQVDAHNKRHGFGNDMNNSRPWTEEEIQVVKAAYAAGNGVDLEVIAKQLSRTRISVAMKASKLGITYERGHNPKTESHVNSLREYLNNQEFTEEQIQARSDRSKAWHAENPHPRGMLGKNHSKEAKQAMRTAQSGKKVPRERVIRGLKTKAGNGTLTPKNKGRSWKSGWREIGGKRIYARSRWEANYARYLELLKKRGQIKEWEHEPEVFWFEGIKRGTNNYTPDFRVTDMLDGIEYHEVKGWMDPKSITKIRRMKKYHPKVKLVVCGADWFKANKRNLSGIIKDWET